jgi:hypothetical protein
VVTGPPEDRGVLVKVSVEGVREPLTYNAPDGTGVGDTVTVPPFSYEPDGAAAHHGYVVAVGSDYTGPVADVTAVQPNTARPW